MPPSGFQKSLDRIRSICAKLPEFKEVEAWGHPTFRAGKKMFAAFGGDPEFLSIGLCIGHDRQEELLEDDRFFPTPYAARLGWISLRIDAQTNWKEVEALIHEAYRRVALQRMLRMLDEKSGKRR